MLAWCASHDTANNLVLSDGFGRTGPGGVARVVWVAGTPTPVVTVPPHGSVPATDVETPSSSIGAKEGTPLPQDLGHTVYDRIPLVGSSKIYYQRHTINQHIVPGQ